MASGTATMEIVIPTSNWETVEKLEQTKQWDELLKYIDAALQFVDESTVKWYSKRREIKAIKKDIDAKAQKAKDWKNLDQRLIYLEEFHPEFLDALKEEFGRDLPYKLKHWMCKGNEQYICPVQQWGDYGHFFSDNESDFLIHLLRNKNHRTDNRSSKEIMSKFKSIQVAWRGSGTIIHKPGKHKAHAHGIKAWLVPKEDDKEDHRIVTQTDHDLSRNDLCGHCWNEELKKGFR